MVIVTTYFSKDPKAANYSEKYTHMSVIRQENKIITTFYSSWNSSYNKVIETTL